MRKIATTAVATIAASLTLAGTASASTGTPRISPEEAGYSVTGAQFKDVSASVYLRNPEQYADVVRGYGHSVQLWSAGLVVVLGVSGTTTWGGAAAGFRPAITVFDRTTHNLLASSNDGSIAAQWCPGGVGSCQPATSGGSFPTGTTVTQRMHYNAMTGAINVKATDTAGDIFLATYTVVVAGQSFNQARIGTEFGDSPWNAPGFTPPARWAKIAVYNDARLVSYTGHIATLESWWVNHALQANTGAQSDTGDWVAIPSDLANAGASFATAFVPASQQRPMQAGLLAPTHQ